MNSCKTILVVEDDHSIRVTLREALESEGFNVLTACNGRDALEVLQSIEKPALIFLDILMPIMDGHQFLKALRADVALAPIPVVITSATASPEEISGADSFIRKPLDLDLVMAMARRHCSLQPHGSINSGSV